MWHRDGPTFLTDNVWVGISFDGTKLWQASFVHFAIGDLGSQMPLGSWILLRGSEKKAIISQLAEVYDLNADLIEVAQQQIPDKGGYLRSVIPFFIADTKAQVILGGCSSVTAKKPHSHCLLAVCEKSGIHRARIWLRDGGDCRGVAVGRDDMPDRAPPAAAPRLWAAWRAPASAEWAFSPREQPPHGASVEEGKGREVGAMVLGSHSDPGTDRHRCGVGRREEG